ncbi:MAG: gamma-glutamylcyclotransferase [bacterium]|nr:gamma-glutamylcyclotransferase [bacterium]
MTQSKKLAFFYGSYINRSVLREVDLVPDRFEVARLDDYDISIRPLANVFESKGQTVWGVVASAGDQELERLYAHALEVLGGIYLPRLVPVSTGSETIEAALCYVADSLPEAPASADYVHRILAPARELGFPEEYIERLESFLPPEDESNGT